MPRGTEEWDSQISGRLQVPNKSYRELFSPKSRADNQHPFSPLPSEQALAWN